MDKIAVTVLEDGSLRMDTDVISGPNHSNAEGLLRDIVKAMGGKTERKRKAHSHGHTHTHGGHTHTH